MKIRRSFSSVRRSAIAFLALALACALPAWGQAAPDRPAQPTPILPFDQVRVGMKGYGLTVYHGVTIEPFPVEVVSVMRDFAPRKGVVWIRCPDARMQVSGPVQGMSGSPIFLWADGEPQELGKGGKLIGAFAFGYAATKDCYVGVQPIENMRDVGGRAQEAQGEKAKEQTGGASPTNSSLELLLKSPSVRALPPSVTWQAIALEKLLIASRNPGRREVKEDKPLDFSIPGPAPLGGRARPMMLPMTLSAPGLASTLAPALEPMGITPLEAPLGNLAGSPPPGIDAKEIPLRPGSVLAIPLAWGDMDLSAQGTVTDVLPDGRVLAFGHAMFGQGPLQVPMASGFVHMVMPGLVTSFKLGGSAVVRGAIVRDESSAVVGIPKGQFAASPVNVSVNMAGQKPQEYHYQVVHHQTLTPMLSAVVAAESMTALQNPPLESTARVRGTLNFAGGRKVQVNNLVPNAIPQSVLLQLLPAMVVMVQNPHESMMLESADLSIQVQPELLLGSLASARLDRTEVKPGDKLGITLRIQPYDKAPIEKRVQLTVPESLADGDYQLHICDAQTYMQMLMASRPHLMTTTNAEELYAMVRRMMDVHNDAIYLILQLQEQGLAIGRQELSRLPSSRKAMIATPTSTLASPFTESVEKIIPMDMAIQGDLNFNLSVRKTRGRQ